MHPQEVSSCRAPLLRRLIGEAGVDMSCRGMLRTLTGMMSGAYSCTFPCRPGRTMPSPSVPTQLPILHAPASHLYMACLVFALNFSVSACRTVYTDSLSYVTDTHLQVFIASALADLSSSLCHTSRNACNSYFNARSLSKVFFL